MGKQTQSFQLPIKSQSFAEVCCIFWEMQRIPLAHLAAHRHEEMALQGLGKKKEQHITAVPAEGKAFANALKHSHNNLGRMDILCNPLDL